MSEQATGIELTLTAGNATEQRVLDYLIENASEVLVEKINAGKKTLAGALKYATEEARKLANGGQCICVDDATVFGWIVHFFEEDGVKEPKGSAKGAVRTPSGVKAKNAESKAHGAEPREPKPEKPRGPIMLELFSAEELAGAKR